MTTVPMHLDPKTCALLVVDIQERLMPVINERERVIRNAVLLIKTAQELGLPIVATTQYAARIGALVPEITAALGEIPVHDKTEFDCFGNAGILSVVRDLPAGVNTLLVCGVETHICVYQTVIGGLLNGYHLWVGSDAVSSRTQANYHNGLARIREIGGVVASTELIIYDLLGRAGTPAFKNLLPLLK